MTAETQHVWHSLQDSRGDVRGARGTVIHDDSLP